MNKLKNPLIIIANGEFPTHSIPLQILDKATSILACDGAANTLIEKGCIPDIIIGDLDSLSDKNREEYKNRIILKDDQSQNDLRKAINYAIDNNINAISILGASGKREDHMIGNIFSLLDYKHINIKIYTDTGIFSCIHRSQKIESKKGQKISVFALDNSIEITSNNLKYNFSKSTLSSIYKGTLNESLSDSFQLSISHGSILIFQSYNQ